MNTPGPEQKGSALLAALHRVEDVVLALLLGSLVLLAPFQIFLRNFFDAGLVWADPFLRLLVLWIALLGALAASRQDKQIAIDVVSKFLSPRAHAGATAVTGLFTALVCAIVAYHSTRFVHGEYTYGSTVFSGVPAWMCEIVIPVAFGLIALRHLGHASGQARIALGLGPPDDASPASGNATGSES